MVDYSLEKLVWTDADFEQMGWHDAYVHAYAAVPEDFEIIFDIDYIFQWVVPDNPDGYFKFWIAPCTIVFQNVYDVEFNFESQSGELIINDLKRADNRLTPNGKMTDWLWTLEYAVTFRATGYKQYVRQYPRLVDRQELTHNERGGLDFSREFSGARPLQ